MNECSFDFYGFKVKLKCESGETANKIKKDFSYFYLGEEERLTSAPDLVICAKVLPEIEDKIPRGLAAKRQNTRAMSFESGQLRFNYFYGKAVSILDYSKNVLEIYSKEESYLHELIYLGILSRETKFHDLRGLHKLHAFGVSKGDTAMLGMMNMKGGKTTLFSFFLDKPGYEIISDDTPLINGMGEVESFPIRIGFELNSHTKAELENYKSKAYSFEREEYGPKELIDLAEFSNPIATTKKRVLLFQGIRVHGVEEARVVEISKVKMLRYLVKNMVVGVGLPMVLEYYLESTWADKLKNFKILLKRSLAALRLLRRSQCFEIYMGNNPEENFKTVKKLLDAHG